MKPKQPLTEYRVTISAKNPFSGTVLIYANEGTKVDEMKIAKHIDEAVKGLDIDYIAFDWTNWFKHKSAKGWKLRKCMNKITKYFELTDKDKEVLNQHAMRAGLIPITLIKEEA